MAGTKQAESESVEDKLLKSEKLVANLQMQLEILSGALKEQDCYVKTLETENVNLRNRIFQVDRIRDGRDRICFDLDVQQFMMWSGNERDKFVTEVVIDAVSSILHGASRTAHLETLRRKT